VQTPGRKWTTVQILGNLTRAVVELSGEVGPSGNVGSMNYLDVYRRESQRDFADGGGVTARAVVEGLFGLRPDALAGELLIASGLPAAWDHATLRHPEADITFTREGTSETYTLTTAASY